MENHQKPETRKRKRDEEVVVPHKYNLRINTTSSNLSENSNKTTKKLSKTNSSNEKADSNANSQRKSIPVRKSKPARKSAKLQLEERVRNNIPSTEFLINEIVLGTVPGYVPWPGRILNITGQTITIEFFGTGEM